MMVSEVGGTTDKGFRRNIFIDRDMMYGEKVENYRKRFGNSDMYVCMYSYEKPDGIETKDIKYNEHLDSMNAISSMYLDFDMDTDKEGAYDDLRFQCERVIHVLVNIWKIPSNMLQIYFSGNKGFHVVIPHEVLNLKPCQNINDVLKRAAMFFKLQFSADTLDTAIYDRRRLFRLPNSINAKSGLYKVPITARQLHEFSKEQMREWAREPKPYPFVVPRYIPEAAKQFANIVRMKETKRAKPKKKLEIPKDKQQMLPCVDRLLRTSIPKGSRNRTMVALASSIMQAGYDYDETMEIIEEWNEQNDPPVSSRELRTTVWSAAREIENGRGWGCNSFREMGFCVGDKCKIRRRK